MISCTKLSPGAKLAYVCDSVIGGHRRGMVDSFVETTASGTHHACRWA